MKKIMLLFLIIPNFSFAQINETLSYADGSKMDVFILNINPDSVYAMRVVNGMEFKDWISSHQIMNYEDLYTEYRYLEKKIPFDEFGNIVFEQVITAENLTADEIFIRVKDWYGQALRDKGSVITYDSRETGKINGIFQKKFTRMKSFGSYIYTPFRSSVNIDIKDNRFKLTCFDFEDLKGSPMNQYLYKKNGEFRKSYYPLYNDLMDTITGLYESILNYVNNYQVDDTW